MKPQANITPQCGLSNSEKLSASGGYAPQTHCSITLNSLALPSLNTQLVSCANFCGNTKTKDPNVSFHRFPGPRKQNEECCG